MNLPTTIATIILTIGLLSTDMNSVAAQTQPLPREIRGYKVERALVEVKKKPQQKDAGQLGENDLIKFGDPKLVKATPLGISLEIPVVVSPVTQKGVIDFLMFEGMKVNGTSVSIEDYEQRFDLPDKRPLRLRRPLKIYISLPSAILAAVDEWADSKETWPVTGRVYVFGKFRKALFSFKRCIPVDLNLTLQNPMYSESGTR
ncbi:MAG TPA: hypothetical protein VLB68_12990 [Pyrinomonadaceae bacterium]|nr:hypothetical protein [Pyrinomonadaceae bacterium]